MTDGSSDTYSTASQAVVTRDPREPSGALGLQVQLTRWQRDLLLGSLFDFVQCIHYEARATPCTHSVHHWEPGRPPIGPQICITECGGRPVLSSLF